MKDKRWILRALFFGYLAWLLAITVFRPGIALYELGRHGVIQTTPFREYYWWLRQRRFGPLLYLFGGNIGVFCPFGAYLAWEKPRWGLARVTLAGLCLSAAIEGGQFLFGTGVTDAADLILNTVGTLVGATVLRGAVALRRRWSRCRQGQAPR